MRPKTVKSPRRGLGLRSRLGRLRGSAEPYNASMSVNILDEMKRFLGFGAADAANLAGLADVVAPHLPRVVERFYEAINSSPQTRRVISGGSDQLERLKSQLQRWLETLFGGVYDEAYAAQRETIGRIHVRVGLPQHFMFAAMEVVREELEAVVRRSGVPDLEEKVRSICRVLSLETAMMLESYKSAYTQRVRQLEHDAMAERVSRVERLAEIGQLAASLAHEIKNPLAGISGAIQVIRGDLKAADPHRRVLDDVLRQIDRLDRTVKDLLTFARPQAPRFKPCRLKDTIDRVIGLLRQEPALKGLVVDHPNPIAETLAVDEHQIEQLLMNLLLNAAQASAAAGARVQLRSAVDGEEVVIAIRDQGQGMDEETRRRAFEPFFTTKARGTGLGLSICQRIVSAHGGAMRLESEPGRGTLVEVRLPLRRVAAESEPG